MGAVDLARLGGVALAIAATGCVELLADGEALGVPHAATPYARPHPPPVAAGCAEAPVMRLMLPSPYEDDAPVRVLVPYVEAPARIALKPSPYEEDADEPLPSRPSPYKATRLAFKPSPYEDDVPDPLPLRPSPYKPR